MTVDHDSGAGPRPALRFTLAAAASLLALVLLLVTAGAVALHGARADAVLGRQQALDDAAARLHAVLASLADAEGGQRGYLLSADARDLAPYQRGVQALPAQLDALLPLAALGAVDRALLDTVRPRVLAALQHLARPLHLADHGDAGGAQALVRDEAARRHLAAVRSDIGALADGIAAERDRARRALDSRGAGMRGIVRAAAVALALLCLLAAAVPLLAGRRAGRATDGSAPPGAPAAPLPPGSGAFGAWSLNLRDDSVHWSDAVRRIHEVAADFVPTRADVTGFYAPEARAAIRAAIDGGQEWDLELPLVTARGRRIVVRVSGTVERGADGMPRRLLGALQDVTGQQGLEGRLADSERFLRRITDALPVRVAYIDPERRFLFANDALCRRYGLARDQVVGRRRGDLPGSPPPALEAHMDAALAGREQIFEIDERGPDGVPRLIQTRLSPDIDAAGRVRGVFTSGIDITTLNAAQRELLALTEVVEGTTDLVLQTDRRGRVRYLNPQARRLLGAAAGGHCARLHPGGTRRRYRSEILPALARDGVWVGETTLLLADARELPVSQMVIAHRDGAGRPLRYTAVMRDISQVLQARAALQLQTATLRGVIEAIPATVAVLDEHFRYRMVNRAFERWRGIGREAVVGRSVAELFGQAEHDRSWPWAQRALGGETVQFEKDYPHAAAWRHVALSYLPLRLPDGRIDGLIGVAQDITVQRDTERRLLDLSEQDALTGVLNRAGFKHMLERNCNGHDAAQLALLYVDLDRFKAVNDSHGHTVGDALLVQFARRLVALVRPSDAVARLGGDEFAVVLTGVREKANADGVADKVVQAALAPFDIDGLTLTVGASVGVAHGADGRGWQGLVERADARLYHAKSSGRGCRA